MKPIILAILILTVDPTALKANDDLKAPPSLVPPVSLKESRTPEYKAAASKVIINRWVEQEKLPYVTVSGHDVKIAISAEVLKAFNVKSGEALPAAKVFQLIDADRTFEKGLKAVAPTQGVIVE